MIILVSHQEFGVCTADICGNPVLPSRKELSFSLHSCSASSHSSHLQEGEDFKADMERNIWSALKNAEDVCKWVGEFCMVFLRSGIELQAPLCAVWNIKKIPTQTNSFVIFYSPRSKIIHKFLALWNIFLKSKYNSVHCLPGFKVQMAQACIYSGC